MKNSSEQTIATKSVKLLVGTTNPGKITELEELLDGLPLTLVSLGNVANYSEVEENGSTFAENASLKAAGYAFQTGLLTLADDSGLEVDALDKAPGVFSARYAGENTGFDEKIRMVLNEVNAIPGAVRSARFVCAMSVADPGGEILFTGEGVCEGSLADAPRGNEGFGYDPIFVPQGFDKTFGELDNRIKQQISHRARAAAKIIRYLHGFLML